MTASGGLPVSESDRNYMILLTAEGGPFISCQPPRLRRAGSRCWRVTGELRLLTAPIPVLLLWFLHFFTPRIGTPDRRISDSKHALNAGLVRLCDAGLPWTCGSRCAYA